MQKELIRDILDDPTSAYHMAESLKSLGNPTRLRIMALLACTGEMTVSDICARLELQQAVVSQQLSRLRLNQQVKARPEGGFRYYSVAVPSIGDLLTCLTRCCRSTRDEAVV